MTNQLIKQIEHMPGPVSIEREEHDVIVIEGVRYSADLFRAMALPRDDVLYAVRRNEAGVVWVTLIRDVAGAMEFFAPTPLPAASPQIEDRDLEGEEFEEGDEDAV